MEGLLNRFKDYIISNQPLTKTLIDDAKKRKCDICFIRITVGQLAPLLKQIKEDYNSNIKFPMMFLTLEQFEQRSGQDHAVVKLTRESKKNGAKGLIIGIDLPIPDKDPMVMQSVFFIRDTPNLERCTMVCPPKVGDVMKDRKRMIKSVKQSLKINGMTDEMIKEAVGDHFVEFLETGASKYLSIEAPNGVTVFIAMDEKDD
jgi:hypothetical protein